VAGQQHPSFHAATVACGLIEDGYEGEAFLREAAQERGCAPQQLCRETAGVLVRGDGRFAQIWDALASQLAIDPPLGEDIHSDDWQQDMDDAFERAIIEILANVRRVGSRADAESVIRGISATLGASMMQRVSGREQAQLPRLEREARHAAEAPAGDLAALQDFEANANDQQRAAYAQVQQAVRAAVTRANGGGWGSTGNTATAPPFFFLSAIAGAGKTYVARALLAWATSEGIRSAAVATSGLAAQLLPDGTTAHRRLGLPVPLDRDSRSSIQIGRLRATELLHIRLLI
jgi:hypothetical protein